MIRILVSSLFGLVCTAAVLAMPQETPDLHDYVGYYELDGGHPVVVSYRVGPGGRPVLLLTNLGTDAFRALFPAGGDRFRHGPNLITPEPVVAELHFLRDTAGAVSGLELAEVDGPKVSGTRVVIDTEPVHFEREGVKLAGTLFLPPGRGDERAPAVVFAHGSEDEGERFQFDAMPWVAAAHGFAALAYDKRGTGESTGSWRAGLEVMAADAVSALAVLRADARVDAKRLGVIGFSEGGWLAPLIARMDGDVAFLVALSGGGMTKGDTFLHKHRRRFVEQGLEGEALEKAMAEKRAMVAASRERAQAGTGSGFDLRISYDPGPDWKRFDGAVLAIMGEADVLQDTPACAAWLRATLAESKCRDWTVRTFPNAHHGMFLAREGGTSEFQSMRHAGMVPGYWPALIEWLDGRK